MSQFRTAKKWVNVSVGESVRIVWELQGLSQNQLAERTGIPQATLSAIENDRVRLGVERAKVLAKALKCHHRIVIVEADPSWPGRFEDEARALHGVLPTIPELQIEHFGSTAVPGLRAKPIIDILIIHPAPELWIQLIEPLASLGYVYWAENPRRDRMFFVKGMPPFGSRRTHHLHVRVPHDSRAELSFRDTLRTNPDLARRYGELKNVLAVRHATDRDAYTDAKTEFVTEILKASAPGGRNVSGRGDR